MAIVTLKDLMDPLSKIEAAAQITNEKLDALIAVSIGSNSGGGLDRAIVTQLTAQTDLLFAIEANTSRSMRGITPGLFSRGGKNKKEVAGAGETLNLLGVGATKTATGMLLWSLVPKKAVTKFTDFVTQTFEVLAKQKPEDVKKGIDNLDLIGGAILKFAKALALSALLIIPGMIAIPFLLTSIALVGGAMALLGMLSKPINKGSRALDAMGDAIKAFGIGLALFAVATLFIIMVPSILIGMVASLVLIGGAVALLGGEKMSKRIRRGSLGLVLVGVALVPFALGVAFFAMATKAIGFKDVLIQGATILAIGGAAALVGKFGIGNILMGATALAVNGLGLMVFSLGYTPFAKATEGLGLGDILKQSALLVAIGAVMGIAGVAVAATAGAALLGPVLFAAAGGALLLLAPGLQAMKDLEYTESDATNLATTLGAVAMAFAGVDPEAGFFANVGNVFSRIGQSAVGGGAAEMYIGAGVALQELSKGLAAFKAVEFTEDDSKELALALGSVNAAFAQAGGEPASPGGLLGAFFGNTFSPNAVERGVDSVMNAGNALTGIAKGLTEFQKLVNSKIKFGDPDDPKEGTLAYAVINTVGFVQKAFAAIGGSDQDVESGGFFSGLFGIKSTATEEGIRSVKGAGKELTNIATGLEKFAGLKNPNATAAKIKAVLGMVGQAFASVGGAKMEDKDGGSFLGFTWDENKIEKGIDAVDGAGAALTDIAAGLKAFSGDFKPVSVAKSIGTLLTSIGTAFTDLYAANPEISLQLKDFSTFIVTLGDVAQDGSLAKAATDIQSISNAINSIDAYKADSLGNLFKGAGELSNNRRAYRALSNAVEEIRDILGAQGDSIGNAINGAINGDSEQVSGGGTETTSNQGLKRSMNKINFTLSQLNSTMKQLPVAISALVDDTNP
jgi:hypothetical protein